jgi:hypothetical protein
MREMMTTKIQLNLIVLQTTSTSPKMVTAPTFTSTRIAHQIVIQAAIGTLSVQKLMTVFAAASSLATIFLLKVSIGIVMIEAINHLRLQIVMLDEKMEHGLAEYLQFLGKGPCMTRLNEITHQ